MPVPKNTRYRFKSVGHGKSVRLAFVGKKKIVEVALFKKVGGTLKKQKILMRHG